MEGHCKRKACEEPQSKYGFGGHDSGDSRRML